MNMTTRLIVEEYNTWNNRNTNKKNIMKPVGIEDLKEQNVSIPKLASDNSILEIVSNKQVLKY